MSTPSIFWKRRLRSFQRPALQRATASDHDSGSAEEHPPVPLDAAPAGAGDNAVGEVKQENAVAPVNVRRDPVRPGKKGPRKVLLHRAITRFNDAPTLLNQDFWVAVELGRQRLWERFLNPHLRPEGHSRAYDLTCVAIAALLFLFGRNFGGLAVLVFAAWVRGSYEKRIP